MLAAALVTEEREKELGEYKLTRDDKKKKKVELPHWELKTIGFLSTDFMQIERLYLSYNYLNTLDGIHNLPNLTHLSLVYNQIFDWREFQKLKLKSKLRMLAVHSNPLCKHPDYRRLLISLFPNLEILDDQKLTAALRRRATKLSTSFSKRLLPFLHWLEQLSLGAIVAVDSEGKTPESAELHRKDLLAAVHQFALGFKLQQRMFIDVNKETEFYLNALEAMLAVMDDVTQGFAGIEFESPNALNRLYREIFRDLSLSYIAEHDYSLQESLGEGIPLDQQIERLFQMWPVLETYWEGYDIHPGQENLRSGDVQFCQDRIQRHQPLKTDLEARGLAHKQNRLNYRKSTDPFRGDKALAHFPCFPFNNTYLRRLLTIVKRRIVALSEPHKQHMHLARELGIIPSSVLPNPEPEPYLGPKTPTVNSQGYPTKPESVNPPIQPLPQIDDKALGEQRLLQIFTSLQQFFKMQQQGALREILKYSCTSKALELLQSRTILGGSAHQPASKQTKTTLAQNTLEPNTQKHKPHQHQHTDQAQVEKQQQSAQRQHRLRLQARALEGLLRFATGRRVLVARLCRRLEEQVYYDLKDTLRRLRFVTSNLTQPKREHANEIQQPQKYRLKPPRPQIGVTPTPSATVEDNPLSKQSPPAYLYQYSPSSFMDSNQAIQKNNLHVPGRGLVISTSPMLSGNAISHKSATDRLLEMYRPMKHPGTSEQKKLSDGRPALDKLISTAKFRTLSEANMQSSLDNSAYVDRRSGKSKAKKDINKPKSTGKQRKSGLRSKSIPQSRSQSRSRSKGQNTGTKATKAAPARQTGHRAPSPGHMSVSQQLTDLGRTKTPNRAVRDPQQNKLLAELHKNCDAAICTLHRLADGRLKVPACRACRMYAVWTR